MFFSKTKKPLLKCYRAHEIPGRIRILCRAVRYFEKERDDLTMHFQELRGVRDARINCKASSIIIRYDPDGATSDELLASVEEIVAAHSLNALQRERAERNKLTVEERNLHEEPLSAMISRSAAAGGLLLTSLIAPTTPTTIMGRLFGFSGFGALMLAYPLFKSGIASLKRSLLPNADTLSAMAVLSSVLTGCVGADGAFAPRPRRSDDGLYDESHALGNPRHALGRERDRLAPAKQRQRQSP